MKVYVGNLNETVSDNELKDLFSAAGTLSSAVVVKDRDSGMSRGFGFLEFESRQDGEKAISQFDGHTLSGSQIKVNEAREKNRQNRPTRDRRYGRS